MPTQDQATGDSNNRPGLHLLTFRPVNKGTLRGFAAVKLRNGLVINDIVVGEANGKTWALLPSKAMVDRDGNLLRDAGGRPRYCPVIEWGTSAQRDEFSRRVTALVHRAYPEAFDAPVVS